MSDEYSTILDYASPRKRSKVRLPAQSTLEIRHSGGSEVMLIERLAGLGGAYGAIVFGIFVLIVAGWRTYAEWYVVRFKSWAQFDTVYVMAVLWLMVATVLVLVIHQTWRRTILHVKDGVLTLTFRTLLGSKRYVWRRDELVMRVAITYMQDFGPTLAELQLDSSEGPKALLLTDHRLDDVETVHRTLDAALRGEAPNLDEQKSDWLANLRQAMTGRGVIFTSRNVRH